MTLVKQVQSNEGRQIRVTLEKNGKTEEFQGEGNGPIEAFMKAINLPVKLRHFEERSLGDDEQAEAMAIVTLDDEKGVPVIGMGRDRNSGTAALKAIVSACNRIQL